MAGPFDPEMAEGPLLHLVALFEQRGGLAYGERVSQLEHALQCAALAESEEAAPELVTAALLHDVGHMLHRDAAGALGQSIDDHHEALGAAYLRGWFRDVVTAPIALHVEAKRYLCHVDPIYAQTLSPVSSRTLQLQGGAMDEAEARRFEGRPHAAAAVRVRRWDDAGKRSHRWTPPLPHYLRIAASCLRT